MRFCASTLFEGQLSEWFGDPKSGKTFALLDLALRVALGLEWYGKQVERGCVIYIALEGITGIKRRIEAWCLHHGVDPDTAANTMSLGALSICATVSERRRSW